MTYYYNPAPGQQNASKYPIKVGPNYLRYGEQAGYIYDPYTDTYKGDPATQKSYYQSQGLLPADPKQESAGSILGPLALMTGISAGLPVIAKSGMEALVSPSAPATATTGVGAGAPIATDAAAMANLSSLGGGAGMGVAQGGTSAAEAGLLDSSFLGEAGGADIGSDFLVPSGSSWFGGPGSFFNTSGMIGPQGSLAAGNILGAAGGGLMMFDAARSGNKTRGIAEGAAGGALAGTSIMPGLGTAIGAGIGGLIGATAHETTKDRTSRRYGELETSDNQAFEAMKQKGLEGSLAGVDTWDIGDDKSKAPIDYMTNSYGVLKTFGPEWTAYSEEQRRNIVQGLVNADKINSKQGEYIIDDPEGAKEIAQSIAGAPAGETQAAAVNSGSSSSGSTESASDDPIIGGLLGNDKKLKVAPGQKAPRGQAPGGNVAPIAVSVRKKGQGPGGLL